MILFDEECVISVSGDIELNANIQFILHRNVNQFDVYVNVSADKISAGTIQNQTSTPIQSSGQPVYNEVNKDRKPYKEPICDIFGSEFDNDLELPPLDQVADYVENLHDWRFKSIKQNMRFIQTTTF